jgi:hypothetical protein
VQLRRPGNRFSGVAATLAAGVLFVMLGAGSALAAEPVAVVNSSPAEPVADNSPVVCTVDVLSIGVGPITGGGSRHAALRFTDTGSRPCVIQGFPRVAYLTEAEGDQVGRSAQQVGPRLGPVILRPGEVAAAPLTMVAPSTYRQAVCQPTPVTGLQVYPPNNAQWVFVALPAGTTAGASNPPTPQLLVSSVAAGPGPS